MTIEIPLYVFWILGVVIAVPVVFFTYIGIIVFWGWNK